jgi:hypothetical protein
MSAPCPSDLGLEAHLLDPAASRLEAHLGSCASCRERIARMEREGQEFHRYVFPATVEVVQDAAGKRTGWPRWLVALAPATALAAAALFLLVAPRHPPEDYVGVKGGLALTIFVQAPGGAQALADGAQVPANAALRFQVRPKQPCRLWLVSVDSTGQVSRLYPPAGEGGAELSQPGPLPGGAILDGRGGPERIYAVCTSQPLPFAAVERTARTAAGGGEAAVRGAGPLRGLPEGAAQETLLLEKQP